MDITPNSPAEPPHATRLLPEWFIPGAILAGLFVLGGLILLAGRQFLPGFTASATPTPAAPLEAAPALGPQNAPVTIIEYADFGCPSCWLWYKQGVLAQLRAKYGDQIRFVWRDYAVITLLSPRAAEAGQCANDQGKFWEYHDAIYSNNGAITAADLKTYASRLGLNMSQFNACLDSHRYRERVLAEQTEAFTHGYNGAPFFLVNGEPLIGAQPLAVFSTLIDPLLASGK